MISIYFHNKWNKRNSKNGPDGLDCPYILFNLIRRCLKAGWENSCDFMTWLKFIYEEQLEPARFLDVYRSETINLLTRESWVSLYCQILVDSHAAVVHYPRFLDVYTSVTINWLTRESRVSLSRPLLFPMRLWYTGRPVMYYSLRIGTILY